MPECTIKERPLRYSADDVMATLDGRKTQFRTPISPQPTNVEALEGRRLAMRRDPINGGHILTFADVALVQAMEAGYGWIAKAFGRCPLGNPDDTLWVQEDWWSDRRDTGVVIYDATPEFGRFQDKPGQVIRSRFLDDTLPTREESYAAMLPKFWTKQPAKTMPRWASRFTLEIREIRVERLREISRDDAFAEGVEHVDPYASSPELPPGMPACFRDYGSDGAWFAADPIASFRSRWDRDNATSKRDHAWSLNEWVWSVTVLQINRPTIV